MESPFSYWRRNLQATPFWKMEPVQTKSRKFRSVWLPAFSVLIWPALFLGFIWERHRTASDIRAVIVTLAIGSAVCVVLILNYLLLPHRRGPYAIHLVGAAIGGLTAISLTDPIFIPLIRIQMQLMSKAMEAFHLPLFRQWNQIMDPFGYPLEIVLIGMAGGWMFVVVLSRLKSKRTLNRS